MDQFGEAILTAVPQVIDNLVRQQLISGPQVQALHPEITAEMAEGLAAEISLALIRQRLAEKLDGKPAVGHSDLKQVVSGTRVASVEALAAIAFALNTSSRKIIAEARRMNGLGDASEVG